MSKTYKKQEIIEMCENASKDMRNFYKGNFVNYKGKAKEGEFYTEIVAEWLLKNKSLFDKIASIERSTSYKVEGHSGKTYRESNRKEEITAKQLFTAAKDYEGFGKIIDYQTPLKNPGGKNNDGLGKIDLLTQNDKNKSVYILELKKVDSDDTMLHCVLEAYTYLRIIAKEKLLNDFKIPTYHGIELLNNANSTIKRIVFINSNHTIDKKEEQIELAKILLNEDEKNERFNYCNIYKQ